MRERSAGGAPADVAVAGGVEILGVERGVGETRLVAKSMVNW